MISNVLWPRHVQIYCIKAGPLSSGTDNRGKHAYLDEPRIHDLGSMDDHPHCVIGVEAVLATSNEHTGGTERHKLENEMISCMLLLEILVAHGCC